MHFPESKRILLLLLLFVVCGGLFAQDPVLPAPRLEIGFGLAENPNDLVVTLEILLLLTILTLAPALLMMLTSFTRVVTVLGILRTALGTRQSPPNQVVVGVSLFLTFFIMAPTFTAAWNDALVPYMDGQIGYEQMFQQVVVPFREFMVYQLRIHKNEDNVDMLLEATDSEPVENIADAPLTVLIPAFTIGELEVAFKMAILLYIPFIMIDMVVASILLAMGMIMIPPVLISMPFKILIFVVVNGWDLLIGGLVRSF
ncbi:MAG TPA: flagellar type III secretion system pore protein FliP [Thermotogota bacterium]|nr:flagellar type III secretion system pore protein FliP [Thermotogota bacterium]HRW92695.1 flagellar type III secretion system pore protein FliP [Thermotogota bacterium]